MTVIATHELSGLLAWAAERAAKNGFAGLTVACEPAAHRWKALMGLADHAGHFVCVQSMAVHRARETGDCTLGKTDHRDAYAAAVSRRSSINPAPDTDLRP